MPDGSWRPEAEPLLKWSRLKQSAEAVGEAGGGGKGGSGCQGDGF